MKFLIKKYLFFNKTTIGTCAFNTLYNLPLPMQQHVTYGKVVKYRENSFLSPRSSLLHSPLQLSPQA